VNAFLIWWTNQADCLAISRLEWNMDVPPYIQLEFLSRAGRNGRGRLWIAPNHVGDGAPNAIAMPETPLAKVLGDDYGGIVIRACDVECLRDLPGVITDLECRRPGGGR
jgi:hypothetical protein